jgi:serine/threonine protein kinase
MLNDKEDLVLVDFGVSMVFEDDDDQIKGKNEGTYKFYAPEMVEFGKKEKVVSGRKADIWAAGITLY